MSGVSLGAAQAGVTDERSRYGIPAALVVDEIKLPTDPGVHA